MIGKKVGTMPVERGRYTDGERTYQRVTNLLRHVETDTYQLDEWKANTLAVGIAERPDLVMAIAAAHQRDENGKFTAEAKKTLKGLRFQAMDAAQSRSGSNTGTALHTATDRLDLGESLAQINLPYPWNASLQAYETTKRTMGLTFHPNWIERTVRLSEWGVAGSLDRFGTCTLLEEMGILQPGELIVVDTKTEQDPTMNGIHIGSQLATYVNADDVWSPAGYELMPPVNRSVGLVMHVRDGRCTPYFVNLQEGWVAAQAAYAQRERLAAARQWLQPVPVKLPAATDLIAQRAAPELAAARQRLTQHAMPGAAPECAVGDTVTAAGVEFTKHSEFGGHLDDDCTNCSPVVAGIQGARFDGTPPWDPCVKCGSAIARPAQVSAGVVETQAVALPNGMTTFAPVPQSSAQQAVLPEMMQFALDAIGAADTLPELADLYTRITSAGVAWEGRIETAGVWRKGIIECPQRELHHGTGSCACRWRAGLRP